MRWEHQCIDNFSCVNFEFVETLFPMFGREFIGFGRREGISPIWQPNTTTDKFSSKQETVSKTKAKRPRLPHLLMMNLFKLSEETLYVMGYNVEWPTSESEQDLAYKVTSSADDRCWPGARGWQMISLPALLHSSLFCKLDSLHLSRENPPFEMF